MNKFDIVSDSSHDLEEDYTEKHHIRSAYFYIRLDEDNYLRDIVDLPREELYKHLRENPDFYPKTSLPSVDDYRNIFRKSLEEGRDILCFTVSSTLSGSFQSANVAANMMMEEYEDRKIYVVDSQSASSGVGLLIKKAVDLREEGLGLDQVKAIVEDYANATEIYILLDSLSYLEKGGRISKTKAIAGNLLKIKPIASFKGNSLNKEGAFRGRKKELQAGIDLLDKSIGDSIEDYQVFLIHGDAMDFALEAKKKIEEKYNIEVYDHIPLVSSAVIAHIGPGAIGIGCFKK